MVVKIKLFALKNFVQRIYFLDAPEVLQIYLSDPSTTYMEGLVSFNRHLTTLIVCILMLVGWLLGHTLTIYEEFSASRSKRFFHSNLLEIVWTSTPVVTLLSIAPLSFSLLYSMDEAISPKISVKAIGHQWFWEYELSDFDYLLSCLKSKIKTIRYECYLLAEETIFEENLLGFLRLLETNKRLLLPSNTHVRMLITSSDVLHSWAVPSFGVKVDACPGRLNQVNLYIKRAGLYFGQCSEICGINHGFMPIGIFVVPSAQFHTLLSARLF